MCVLADKTCCAAAPWTNLKAVFALISQGEILAFLIRAESPVLGVQLDLHLLESVDDVGGEELLDFCEWNWPIKPAWRKQSFVGQGFFEECRQAFAAVSMVARSCSQLGGRLLVCANETVIWRLCDVRLIGGGVLAW